jgi:spermidine/putrescine transport system permease protein
VEATTAPLGYVRRESAPSRAWTWLREHAINIYAVLAIAYLLVPIAVIIFFSFNNPAGRYNYNWVGFTLDHWRNVFGLPDLNDALFTSLRLALFATLISTAIGTLMALALVRYQFFGRRTANFLIVIPMATPEVVMGAALLSFFLIVNTPTLGFSTLLIAHVMFCISFVVVVVRSRLIGFDRSLEEAARDLGANPFQTFMRVTLPLIFPGIIAAALLAFALSIDELQLGNHGHVPPLHLRRLPAWNPGRGERDRHDPLRDNAAGDGVHRVAAATRRATGIGASPAGGGRARGPAGGSARPGERRRLTASVEARAVQAARTDKLGREAFNPRSEAFGCL